MPKPFSIRVDLGSPVPVYRQIVDSLRALLVNEAFGPGTLLPPVRQLATDLGVHFNTVAEAYRTLADEGWLDLRRGRGALVIERSMPTLPANSEKSTTFSRRLRELVAELQAAGISRSRLSRELRLISEGLEK